MMMEKVKKVRAGSTIGNTGIPVPHEHEGGRTVIEIERTITVRNIPSEYIPRKTVIKNLLTALMLSGASHSTMARIAELNKKNKT